MSEQMKIHYYFKTFNNVKSDHESLEFAKIELESLFRKIEPIYNFMDIISKKPLKIFTTKDIRIQDILAFELPYGKIQGYYGESEELIDITNLVKRLAYTREILLIVERNDEPKSILKKVFPDGTLGKNVHYYEKDNLVLFRFITNQFFLEKSQYVSKLSRFEEEIDANVEILFSHLIENIQRIPSSSTLAIGKKLEDWFTIREEPSLYLNHYMHAYKGKFHPKMTRALVNYVFPKTKGVILDNFAGCGTALVEGNYLGLDSLGVEINPLSVLMCNVKCNSVNIQIVSLKQEINNFINNLESEIDFYKSKKEDQQYLLNRIDKTKLEEFVEKTKIDLYKRKKTVVAESTIRDVFIARELLKAITDETIHEFILLSISGAISDGLRRSKATFLENLKARLNDLYRRLYLYHKLNEVLKIKKRKAKCHIADTRDMIIIKSNSVDGIVNSPPYSTAIDYIGNDYPQLVLLGLVDSFEQLEEDMMGNPRVNFNRKEIQQMIDGETENPIKDSSIAMKYIKLLIDNDRADVGHRAFKFFNDMFFTLKEMHRVLKKGAKSAIVIGNNHYKINEQYKEIPNDEVLLEMAKDIGFKEDIIIKRELHKTQVGNIRRETILFLQK